MSETPADMPVSGTDAATHVAGADVSALDLPLPNVLVGVTPQQTQAVLYEAALLADRLGATLICAYVDASRYVTDILPDGSVFSVPLDPDQLDADTIEFDPRLAAHIRDGLARVPTPGQRERPVVLRALVGDPALALAALAESAQSTYVVIGTRRSGIRAGMKEFFGGSVAAHLAHRQSRPVLVVPVAPTRADRPLPWEVGVAEPTPPSVQTGAPAPSAEEIPAEGSAATPGTTSSGSPER